MILKGSTSTGTERNVAYLAGHLQRRDTNEVVYVLESVGTIRDDLYGAIEEMAVYGLGTACRKPLYHLNIDPDPEESPLTDAQYLQAADHAGEALGLAGQPRVVVKHVKDGRAHIHILWSRIDLEKMRTIPNSWNYVKHEIVARDLERLFSHEYVQGAFVGRDGSVRPARRPSNAEVRQGERTGFSPYEAREFAAAAWAGAVDGPAFSAAVSAAGWALAQGDRKPIFVLIDPVGGVHSLARVAQISAANIKTGMRGVDLGSLPSVETARHRQRGGPGAIPEPTLPARRKDSTAASPNRVPRDNIVIGEGNDVGSPEGKATNYRPFLTAPGRASVEGNGSITPLLDPFDAAADYNASQHAAGKTPDLPGVRIIEISNLTPLLDPLDTKRELQAATPVAVEKADDPLQTTTRRTAAASAGKARSLRPIVSAPVAPSNDIQRIVVELGAGQPPIGLPGDAQARAAIVADEKAALKTTQAEILQSSRTETDPVMAQALKEVKTVSARVIDGVVLGAHEVGSQVSRGAEALDAKLKARRAKRQEKLEAARLQQDIDDELEQLKSREPGRQAYELIELARDLASLKHTDIPSYEQLRRGKIVSIPFIGSLPSVSPVEGDRTPGTPRDQQAVRSPDVETATGRPRSRRGKGRDSSGGHEM